MSSSNSKIVLYGTDLSQPCRTVSWLLRAHNVPFDYETVIPGGKKGTRSQEFLKKNKAGLVPVLEHNGNLISEYGAIIVYLAEVFKWDDVYPLGADKAGVRASINTWLHWMHRNSREFSIAFFAPLVRRDLKFAPERIKELQFVCKNAAKLLENQLAETKFLVGNTPTLADYAVYADIGQCSEAVFDLFDFKDYPNVSAWLDRMAALPFYEETHESLVAMKGMVEDAKKKAKL